MNCIKYLNVRGGSVQGNVHLQERGSVLSHGKGTSPVTGGGGGFQLQDRASTTRDFSIQLLYTLFRPIWCALQPLLNLEVLKPGVRGNSHRMGYQGCATFWGSIFDRDRGFWDQLFISTESFGLDFVK